MGIAQRLDARLLVFAAAAAAFAVWALIAVSPHDSGTLQRPGPALMPELAATMTIIVAALVMARAATGRAAAPIRLLPQPWRLVIVLVLLVIVLLPDILALFARASAVAAIRAWFRELTLDAGPADFLMLAWLRWTLAIALGVVAAGTGALSGLLSLLVGALIGLSGVDLGTGISRMIQLDSLMEDFPWAVEIAVLLLMLACRVNPLPAVLTYGGATAVEDLYRRAVLLTKGDVLQAVVGPPMAFTVFVIIALIVVAMAWYRWPWRDAEEPPAVA